MCSTIRKEQPVDDCLYIMGMGWEVRQCIIQRGHYQQRLEFNVVPQYEKHGNCRILR